MQVRLLADKDIRTNWPQYKERFLRRKRPSAGGEDIREKGQPVVYVKIKRLEPARSRIREMELTQGG